MPIINGLYGGTTYYVKPATQQGASEMDTIIDDYMQTPSGAEGLVGLYMCPSIFAVQGNSPAYVDKTYAKAGTVGGRTPRNRKLLTFPFCYLELDSLNDTRAYKYELFKDNVCKFHCVGSPMGNPNFVCAPVRYDGSASNVPNYTNELVVGGYPQCAINVSTYKQWLASNGVYNVIGALPNPVSIAEGNLYSISQGILGLATAAYTNALEKSRSNTARGPVASDTNVANRSKDVYVKRMGLRPEQAEMVDSFFDRYGYACNKVKTPNIHVRESWTYTKTRNCVIKGNIPADAIKRIADCFNSGITFWVALATVGDYSQSNEVLP